MPSFNSKYLGKSPDPDNVWIDDWFDPVTGYMDDKRVVPSDVDGVIHIQCDVPVAPLGLRDRFLFLENKKPGEGLSGGQQRLLEALDAQPQNTVALVESHRAEDLRWTPGRVLFFDRSLGVIEADAARIGWYMRQWVAYARQTGGCYFRDYCQGAGRVFT